MSRVINIFKGLGYAYIFTLIIILIYNAILTFTQVSSDNMGLVVSVITTFGAAFGGIYACKHIKEKGLIYGLLEGFLYILFLMVFVFLARENFSFEVSMLYNVVLTTIAGGIGGVIGVNF